MVVFTNAEARDSVYFKLNRFWGLFEGRLVRNRSLHHHGSRVSRPLSWFMTSQMAWAGKPSCHKPATVRFHSMKIGKLREGTPVIAASSGTQMALLSKAGPPMGCTEYCACATCNKPSGAESRTLGPSWTILYLVVKLRSWLEMPTKALTFNTNFVQIVRYLVRFYTQLNHLKIRLEGCVF